MGDTPYQPLTGDPDVLKSKATHYLAIADAIQRSVVTLNKIHDDTDGQVSQAVDSMRGMTHDVASDINKAHDRYQKTSEALLTYAAALRAAQDDATTAITHIEAKQSAADAAHSKATTAQQAADDAKGDAAKSANKAASNAKDAATSADQELAAAHQEWHDAVDKKNTAAQAAIKKIVDVVDHHNNGLKNPSWWDKFVSIVEKIGDIAGVLAIFLSWVPVLGEVLIVIAAVASIVKLIDSVVKFANGEGTFLDVLGSAVGCVLTLFGGRIFTFLGKAARIRSLTRAPQMIANARNDANAALRLRAGNTMMKNAVGDLFKVPRFSTRADFLNAVRTTFTHSAAEQRAAYKALFTGSTSRLDALGKLAGVNKAVWRAARDDLANGYKDPVAAAAVFNQVQSLWNKGAGIVNVPSSVKNIFTGDTGKTVPDLNLTDLAVKGLDKVAPTYKSYN